MGEAGDGLSLGLDAEHDGGVVENGFLGGLADVFPRGAAELGKDGCFAAEADVFSDEVGLIDGDREEAAVAVFDGDVFVFLALLDANEAADAVFGMDDEVSFGNVVERSAGGGDALAVEPAATGGGGVAVAAEDFAGGNEGELGAGDGEAFHQLAAQGDEVA